MAERGMSESDSSQGAARVYDLSSTHLRLGTAGSIEPMAVDENFWPDLIAGKFGDFRNEYLVTSLSFEADWRTWEQHPNGDEFVFLISGSVDFVLEIDGEQSIVPLRTRGQFVIVPKAAWHTARVLGPTTMLFITAGEGTLIRPV